MRKLMVVGLRVLALAVVLMILLGVGAQVSGVAQAAPAAPPPDPAQAASAAGASLLFCGLASAVLSWMILRSTLVSWPLAAAVFLAHFGLGTVMFQIESLVFLPRHLPPGFVPKLFAMGALVAAVFAPAAVWMHRRFGRPVPGDRPAAPATRLTPRQWALRLSALAAVYVALYFLAGYYIAFRNPELVAYYDEVDAGGFLAGMARVWSRTPWLFALQAVRGLLWVAIVLPFILNFRGRSRERSVMIGAAFAVWTLALLLPNPYMPESVRLSHLVETGSSNFVFGCLVGAALGRRD